MQTIMRTVHIADDGTEFIDKEKCRAYEDILDATDAIMATLPHRPKGMPHGTYIRHTDLDAVRQARLFVLRASQPYVGGSCSWLRDTIDAIEGRRGKVHYSYASRIIGECAPAPLERAWSRLSMIDDEGREWEQRYFVDHPNEGSGELQP